MTIQKVEAHTFSDPSLAEDIDEECQFLGARALSRAESNIGDLARTFIHAFFENAVSANGLGLTAERDRFVDASLALAQASWTLIGSDLQTLAFQLGGKTVNSSAWGKERLPHPTRWVTALTLAVCCKRQETIELLVRLPRAHIDEEVGAFWSPRIAAIQKFMRREPDWKECQKPCLDAYVASAGALDRFGQLMEAEFELMRTIDAGDSDAYIAALVMTLKKHKAYFGRGPEKAGGDARVALLSCMLVVVAKQRGLRHEVESDYLPRWLVGAS